MMDGGCEVGISAGHAYVGGGVHVVQILCLTQLTC